MKDTDTDEKVIHRFRYVTVRGTRYLHVEDVAAFVRQLGGVEETDVRTRLYEAANNLQKRIAR